MKIIVIGASGTIGSAVVKALAERGHDVVGVSRHAIVSVNIEEPNSIRAMFNAIVGAHAVVCCAGEAVFKPFASGQRLRARYA